MSALISRIELFGSLRVTSGTQTVTRFRTHKTGLLLAYLASYPQRPQRREELIDRLWPEYELDSGRNCLRIALNALRQQFQCDSATANSVILADRQCVQLNPQAVTIDKSEFESCLARAQRTLTDEDRGALLKQAIAMYHGDLLLDYDAEWIEGVRKPLADAHLLALRRLIKLLANTRALDEALHYAQTAVAADPIREESHRMLMQLYGALRSPGAAVRQYQELTRILGEQLNTIPSAATRSLLARITNGLSAPPVGAGSVATLVGSAGMPTPAPPPPPASAPFVPGVLPVPRTRFVGREDCLAQVLEMFETPETRLITLTGLGGSGKTRLALAVAERLQADFHGAVWFVPLVALADAERLPETLLHALERRIDGSAPALEQVVHALAGRPALLVLDNFERLADEGGVVIQRLLDRLPMMSCLVTSHQRLNVAGEYEFAVQPLATPLSPGTPERLQEFASVQLFVDRAKCARRDFELTTANAAAVAALCHHLEGVPLSIELAAAYVQALSPAQILARLTPRLPLLVNRQKDAPARHASLRATLEWSYDLLPASVQRFLARLSVFRDGWDIEAAEAVCAEPNALEYLLQLRERSLASVEEIGDSMRYRLLEIVREFAAERLAPEERSATSGRHTAFFLAQAETAESDLVGAHAAPRLAAMEREHANFRAALAFALAQPTDTADPPDSDEAETRSRRSMPAGPLGDTALRLAGALWRFWYLHGHYEEGTDWLRRALAAGETETPAALKAWRGVGNLAYDRGDLDRAYAAFTQLLSLSRQTGRREEEAAALGSLGNVALEQGDLAQSQRLLEESLSLFQQSGDSRGSALVLANLALVTLDSGDATRACSLHRESLGLFEEVRDTQNIALALNNLGHAAIQAGDYAEARRNLLASLTLAGTLGSPFLELYVVVNLACLTAHQERWRHAALLCGVADSRLEEKRAGLLPKAAIYYREQRATIQKALSIDEFARVSEQGRNMRVDQLEALIGEMHMSALAQ